jgi:FkbM family methyltransferase
MISTVKKLRPAKVRTALRRRWFEYRLQRLKLEPIDGLEQLGTDYGGWIVPTGAIGEGWTCYCVGAGGDITVDAELIQRCRATVRCFEPDEEYAQRARAHGAKFPGFSCHQVAVAANDGPVRMQRTHIPNSRSLSPADLYDTHDYVEVQGRTLESLMRELGDHEVQLLKLDIEGGEYDVVPKLDLRGMGTRVFSTQLHHTGSVREARQLIAHVCAQGFRLVANLPAVKLTFVRDDFAAAARDRRAA